MWQHAGHCASGWAEIDLSKNDHANYNKSTTVTATTGTIGKPDWQNGVKLHSVGFSDFEEGMTGGHPAPWYKGRTETMRNSMPESTAHRQKQCRQRH